MSIPTFDEKELQVVDGQTNLFIGKRGTAQMPIFNYPVTPKEAVKAMYERKPVWQITTFAGSEIKTFTPRVIPDNIARALVLDGSFVEGVSNKSGGLDMFGINWEYEAAVGGSTVRPGNPLVKDATELKEKVVWPDIDAWDWEGSRDINQEYLETDKFVNVMFFTGFFEKLIAFMDFEGALVALVDEDQKEEVKEFLDKLSDLYIRIFDKVLYYFPQVDGFSIHDDWGGENNSCFSPEIATEMIVPYMRKVTDFIHSKGRYCDLHSCGKNQSNVPSYIAAGWDSYTPQDINDLEMLYDTYGDQILIATLPEVFDPETTSETEQREIAKRYVTKYCHKEKPSTFSMYTMISTKHAAFLTPTLCEEVYRQSRIAYSS